MSINLKKRTTTGPATAFVSCTQLPVREDIIFRQDMVSYRGGGGGSGARTSSSNAGRIAQVGGTYEPDTGGVTRRTQQLMEGSALSNPGGGQTGLFSTKEEIRENSLYGRIGNAITSGAEALGNAADALGDAASEGLEDGVNYMITGMALAGRQ
ncbi:hypothetical protein F4Z98_15380 [Candidatus Poribacteria bacterium]|nr:hypothetical protein [Candidatus Poribacteria bacterium]MYB55465.1 hypothetical protein [Gemmatimonadota bacterium]